MSEVQLRVKHNIATYDLKFNEEETLGTLGHKLLELTGIAHICHNRHNRRWCTFFELVYF